MTGGFWEGDVFRGLAFRVLLFLTLALLPFGVIAVVQTSEIARQASANAELSLLGLTERAASAERAILQEGFGVAEALSSILPTFEGNPEACSAFMAKFREDSSLYSLVGFLPKDGFLACSSSNRPYDFNGFPGLEEAMATPQRGVTAVTHGPLSGQAVLVLTHPVFAQDTFDGFAALSVPLAALRTQAATPPLKRAPDDLVVFNREGEVLLSNREPGITQRILPQNRSLKTLVGEKPSVFRDVTEDGIERVYAVVPIVAGVVYSMSIWPEEALMDAGDGRAGLSLFLPVLMWVASLVVAFWSINRLAIRHIQKLGRQMRLFAYNRALPRAAIQQNAPRELVDIEKAFIGMADSIIRDEAALEDNIRDKNILLKEVHHRVKNNLQLISSIMNMQIRRAQSDDARRVLRRLQDRILSLATVHKNLYQNDALDRVDAGALLREIVGQLMVVGLPAGSGVKLTQSFDRVDMDADDAAPLTLLVSEAVTNALKYIGPSKTGRAFLDIRLVQSGDDTATFEITNSSRDATGDEGTGLGAQLISAFARQLNAQVDVTHEVDEHRLSVRFPVRSKDKLLHDY